MRWEKGQSAGFPKTLDSMLFVNGAADDHAGRTNGAGTMTLRLGVVDCDGIHSVAFTQRLNHIDVAPDHWVDGAQIVARLPRHVGCGAGEYRALQPAAAQLRGAAGGRANRPAGTG